MQFTTINARPLFLIKLPYFRRTLLYTSNSQRDSRTSRIICIGVGSSESMQIH